MASVSGGDQSPEANGTKRKGDEDGAGPGAGAGAGQGRAKRNRYISIACNECKRRKIKCNGQMPCHRCGNLNLDCVYAPNCCASSFKDSEDFHRMNARLSALQEQVDTLFSNVNGLRSHLAGLQPPIDPSLQHHAFVSHTPSQASPGLMANPTRASSSKGPSGPRPPSFRGPTSTEFNLGVAKNSLQTMGITPRAADDDDFRTQDVSPAASPPPDAPMHASKDPIWAISRDEAFRLLRVYEDEMHDMYPVLPLADLVRHTDRVYTFMETAERNGLVQTAMPGADAINDDDTNLLKLVLAISLTVEGLGRSELGKRLRDFVQPAVDALLLGHAGAKGVRILALTAMYEFHCDNESTAWRVIGLTTRLCIELGLHRKETYDAMTEQECNATVLLFWAVYCLDRRWSFGTGMPFALQDSDIDPNLPKPDDTLSAYLKAMIEHFAIASKVWHAISSNTPTSPHGSISKEEVEYLDYQITNWHRKLPDHLRYSQYPQELLAASSPGTQRSSFILYLRANNMRIHLYRPVLHSATSIVNNQSAAQTVVDVAKDTIRNLRHLSSTTKMYQASQVLFNAFMVSALAVLFLAVSHAPALFAENVREEFYMALDLVRGLSRESWVSKRLWRTIRVLKEVAPKLGLAVNQHQQQQHQRSAEMLGEQQEARPEDVEIEVEDPSRSAAVAMAGLAGHNVDESALYAHSHQPVHHQQHHHQQQHQHQQQQQQLQHHFQQNQNQNQNQYMPSTQAWSNHSNSSPDGSGMVHDLTTLFEGATASNFGAGGGGGGGGVAAAAAAGTGNGYHGLSNGGGGGGGGGDGGTYSVMGGTPQPALADGMDMGAFGGEDELSRIMRDLF
ncbi:hypothetical protein MBLNU459_g6973t1 [Dothideomycetes sp. NU459]